MLHVVRPPVAPPPVLEGLAAWKCYLAFFRDQIGQLARLHQQHGSQVVIMERIPFRKRVQKCVVVSGAEYNQQVLGDPDTYHSSGLLIRGPRDSVLNRLRLGLIGLNGEKHRDQRRMVSSFFLPKAIRQYGPQMVDTVARQLDTWPVGKTTDISERISHISLLISAQNLFAGGDVDDALRMAEMTAGMLTRSSAQSVWLLPFNVAGTPYRGLVKYAETLEREMLRMIDRRPPAEPDSPHLLDRLIAIHRAQPHMLSREDLVSQVFVLFGASHETVAKAVIWSLFLLAQHPGIMAELHDELRGRCGGDPPSIDDVGEMPLLDAVTKEAMRLFPPVPWVRRCVRRDAKLGSLDLHMRDSVILNHYVTHRDPNVFAEPDQFRPERWFDAAPESYAYVPFSAGPRNCIGRALGTVTINLLVSMIVQRFRLSVVPRSRIDRSVHITLAPKYGMPMHLVPQDGQFTASPVTGNVHEMVDLSRADATTRPMIIPISTGHAIPRERRRAA